MATNVWRIKKLGDKIVNLEKAIELVLSEAETSALGEGNQPVLDAVELIQSFYEEFGHQFSNFSIDITDKSINVES
jgi:hypothetical protein